MADALPSVSVILPTYNERENIEVLIPDIESVFAGIPLEILVVDDTSPDGTAEAARALSARYGNVRVILRQKKEGIGAAIRHGLEEAGHEVLISSDSDMSFRAPDMLRLYRKILEGYDLVIGSRHSQGARYEQTHLDIKVKYLISYLGNRCLRVVTGLKLHDFSANFRAIRRNVWRFLDVRERTNTILLEMILKAAYGGLRVAEIPVTFAERLHGESKLNLAVEAPKFLLKMVKYVCLYRFTGYNLRLNEVVHIAESLPRSRPRDNSGR
jgi:dolichol-phosphate mannosyltransferase